MRHRRDEGAPAGFEEFVRAELPGLLRYAHLLTGDRYAAEDLVQDTLVRVADAWPRIEADRAVRYVRVALVHANVSRLRRQRRRVPAGPLTGEAPPAADPGLGAVEDRLALRPALAALTPLQRAVIVLGYFDDLDDAAIAAVVRRRRATVRSLRQRALGVLRDRMAGAATGVTTEVRR